jgi:hypothetical protein
MSLAFPKPDHMPCPVCGASVPVDASGAHVCEESRRLEFRLAELRDEIERFPADFGSWLETPAGRFAQWLAERDR